MRVEEGTGRGMSGGSEGRYMEDLQRGMSKGRVNTSIPGRFGFMLLSSTQGCCVSFTLGYGDGLERVRHESQDLGRQVPGLGNLFYEMLVQGKYWNVRQR